MPGMSQPGAPPALQALIRFPISSHYRSIREQLAPSFLSSPCKGGEGLLHTWEPSREVTECVPNSKKPPSQHSSAPRGPKSPQQALCEHCRTRCPGTRFVRSSSAGLQPCWGSHKQKSHAESQHRSSSHCKEPPQAFQPQPLHLRIPAPSWEVPMSPCMDRAVGWGDMAWLSGAGRPPGGSYRLIFLGTTRARRCRTSLAGSYQWPPPRASPDPDAARNPGQVPRHPSTPAHPGGSYL